VFVQGKVSHHLLQSAVFIFQSFEPFEFADGQAGLLGFPVVVGGVAHAVLPAQVSDLRPGFSFFKNRDDLLFGVLFCLQLNPPLTVLL
jgi:hypothetical protein